MSDWDFLWKTEGEERQFAMQTGMTYSDLSYIENKEQQARKRREIVRIKERNKAWYALKRLRESGKISPDEFKKKKNEIFAVEIERKMQNKALICKLREYSKHSVNNRKELSQYVKCICYGCLADHYTYHISYDGDTAVCPTCKRKTIISYLDGIGEHIYDLHNLYFPENDIDELYED